MQPQARKRYSIRCEAASQPPFGDPIVVANGLVRICDQIPLETTSRQSRDNLAQQLRQVLQQLDACLVAARLQRRDLLEVDVSLLHVSGAPWGAATGIFEKSFGRWLSDGSPSSEVAPLVTYSAGALPLGALIKLRATALLE